MEKVTDDVKPPPTLPANPVSLPKALLFAIGTIASLSGLYKWWKEGLTIRSGLLTAGGACSLLVGTTGNQKMNIRDWRKQIFEATERAITSNRYCFNSDWVELSGEKLKKTKESVKLYENPSTITNPESITTISIYNGDCVEVALKYKKDRYKTALLNMANATHPGGGVRKGAGAQEENLCRRSDYYWALNPDHNNTMKSQLGTGPYRIPEFGGIYAKPLFFRGTEADGYPFMEEPVRLGVIASAAYNLAGSKPFQKENTKRKIRGILRIAHAQNIRALVLSAFGCGAFHNPPQQVAEAFKAVLEEDEFKTVFRHIAFAIIDDHNAPKGGNVQPFASVFTEGLVMPLNK